MANLFRTFLARQTYINIYIFFSNRPCISVSARKKYPMWKKERKNEIKKERKKQRIYARKYENNPSLFNLFFAVDKTWFAFPKGWDFLNAWSLQKNTHASSILYLIVLPPVLQIYREHCLVFSLFLALRHAFRDAWTATKWMVSFILWTF